MIKVPYSKDEIIKNYKMLFGEKALVEIRIPEKHAVGYFDNAEDIANTIINYDSKYNIFWSLNEINPALFDLNRNKIIEFAKAAAKDTDILKYRYILIDIDPDRPSKTSATNAEKDAAKPIVEAIRKELENESINPLICSSGNGFHILIRVDMVNVSDNIEAVKSFLLYFDWKFSTEKVHIDTGVYKPSQLTKLYGTIACKGENTEERPHRRSKVNKFPPKIEITPTELIFKIADRLPKGNPVVSDVKQGFKIEEWLNKNNLKVFHKKPFGDNGQLYVLDKCPWNPEHNNHSAYVIQFQNGAIAAGCRHNSCQKNNWRSLKNMYPEQENENKKSKKSSSIIEIASKDLLFLTEHGDAYAAISIKGHNEIVNMKSKKYKRYLTKLYYEKDKSAPSTDIINETLQTLMTLAEFSGNKIMLHKRATFINDTVYYDLCDDEWRAVKISSDKVEIDPHPPILFTRSSGMLEQVLPDLSTPPSELLNIITNHFRVKNYENLIVLIVYMITCFIAPIPHPILVLSGEHGAAKSTSLRMLQKIVDPSAKELLSMPKAKDALAQILNNNYMPIFDNLSVLTLELSNTLCMASTGGSFPKRELYTDIDDIILDLKCCAVLNGVNFAPTQPDLLDRSILIELDRIPKSERKSEKSIWEAFNTDLPKILGGIFNTLAKALPIYSEEVLDETFRMADFCYHGYAIAEVLGIGGKTFIQAYEKNQNTSNDQALENHPVAAAMMAFMNDQKSGYTSSISALLMQLELIAEENKIDTRSKLWPKETNWLSKRLKEVKSNLEEVGITYKIDHLSAYKQITIFKETDDTTCDQGSSETKVFVPEKHDYLNF